jgi:hypothetical protein
MNRHPARPHIFDDNDYGRAPAAKPRDFVTCNGCRYPFAKRPDGGIDMDDFRRHKEECPKRLLLTPSCEPRG